MTLLGVLKTREYTPQQSEISPILGVYWSWTKRVSKNKQAKTGTVENHAEVTIATPDFSSILKAISRACERENERKNSP